MKTLIKILTAILFATFSANAFAATYVVDNMTDGDNFAAYTLSDGTNTLRKCIRLANASVGSDIINFAAAATGTITLTSNLPAISGGTVTINGGGTANTALTGGLNGTLTRTISGANAYSVGITVSSDNNIIRGLNFINIGTAVGTTDACIYLTSGADNNQILGCYIGTDVNGTASAGSNTERGVMIFDAATNKIGDGTAAGRNLISGLKTTGSGIYFFGGLATGNTVKGNVIGLQKDGITFLATTQEIGVNIEGASSNTIGGTVFGEGNVISGNSSVGIRFSSISAAGNTALGNIIGPQADGISNVTSNAQAWGVYMPGTRNHTIGGSTAGARNIISANLFAGIYFTSVIATGNVVKGNYIGSSSTLGSIAGSSQDYGVFILNSAANNTIGGSVAGEANTIAFNTVQGVYLTSAAATGNKISRNPIYSNGTPIGTGKPINLNYGASQANNGKPVPVITTANTTTVVGTSGAGDIVEVFKNSTGNCNDAVTFVGAATANGSGNWSLIPIGVVASDFVFATATDGNNNTSEFIPCVVPLPVELLYFTAVLTVDKKVLCQWATASEINNDYFIVQRTRDGINYEFITKVDGAPGGNSSTTLYYSALDPDPYSGTSYYRLKQVDFNSTTSYSQLVPINLKSIDIINIYPNPSFNDFNYLIGSADADEITITVLDVLGRNIIQKQEFIDAGITKKNLNISFLASGSYLLQITTKTMEKVQKQFVVK